MSRKSAVMLLLVVAVVSGVLLGRPLVAKLAARRHLAAAETAMTFGDYRKAIVSFEAALAAGADAIETRLRLAEARTWAASADLLQQGREHLAGGQYDLASQTFGTIPQGHPQYGEAQQLILRANTLSRIAFLSQDWGVEKDLEAGRFVLASPTGGMVELKVERVEFEVRCDTICGLEYLSPSGTRYVFPLSFSLGYEEEFPATILAPDCLLVKGDFLWKPPAYPEPAYPEVRGMTIGWSVNPQGTMAAAAFLENDGARVKTLALDLRSLRHYLVSSYRRGRSFPYEWYDYVVGFRWPDEWTVVFESYDGPTMREVTWRKPQ